MTRWSGRPDGGPMTRIRVPVGVSGVVGVVPTRRTRGRGSVEVGSVADAASSEAGPADEAGAAPPDEGCGPSGVVATAGSDLSRGAAGSRSPAGSQIISKSKLGVGSFATSESSGPAVSVGSGCRGLNGPIVGSPWFR
jgi:hypothetical protein